MSDSFDEPVKQISQADMITTIVESFSAQIVGLAKQIQQLERDLSHSKHCQSDWFDKWKALRDKYEKGEA